MVIRPHRFILRSSFFVAGDFGDSDLDKDQDARWSCILCSEACGEGWEVIQVP